MKTAWMTASLLMVACTVGWAEQIEKRCPAPADTSVYVKNVAGSIDINAWDKEELLLKAVLGPDVERLDFECRDGHVHIEVIVPKNGSRKITTTIQVWAPASIELETDAVSASTRIKGIRGVHRIKSVSGKIESEGSSVDLQVESVSGGITVSAYTPEVYLKSVSGEIEFAGEADQITANTVSGDITLKGNFQETKAETTSGTIMLDGKSVELSANTISGDIVAKTVEAELYMKSVSGRLESEGLLLEDAEISTISGAVILSSGLDEDADVSIQTRSGSVDVAFPEIASAEYEIRSMSGGIQSEFGPDSTKSGFGPGSRLDFEQGDGEASVEIETLSGSIHLRRR